MTIFAKAATIYAAAGWPVFPCEPGGKAPLGRLAPHGFKDATTDPGITRRWWTSEPEANIGAPTGVVFDVLDVDVRGDGDGFPALRRLARAGLLVGAFAEAETRNGGRHYLYPPSGSGCRAFHRHRLDVKAAGGYIVLPPSRVPADDDVEGPGRYRWLDFEHDLDPRPLNVEAISNRLNPPLRNLTQPSFQGGGGVDALLTWITRLSNGNRNNGFFWAACRAAETGDLDHDAFVRAAMTTGMTEAEARRTVKSAAKVEVVK